jgi:peroxin-19
MSSPSEAADPTKREESGAKQGEAQPAPAPAPAPTTAAAAAAPPAATVSDDVDDVPDPDEDDLDDLDGMLASALLGCCQLGVQHDADFSHV